MVPEESMEASHLLHCAPSPGRLEGRCRKFMQVAQLLPPKQLPLPRPPLAATAASALAPPNPPQRGFIRKAKAGDLAGCLLRRKAFRKPPQRRRLSEGLGHRGTASPLVHQKLFGLPPYPLRGTEREFLEAVGYYNLWIPGLIEIAKSLDSNVTKPFHLHVSEVRGIAKGILIQTLGPWKRPVAYLSKRLDPVVAGWPACLQAVATTALLVKEADK
ncbi:hypothetical protein QTO34_010618 [Cnephaeus nilssonii]|uniref:Uncharacterized protein n=1 Tax=Cnephaeus nilssonii TaxID=3371016 RepID=A0AA40HFQ3_CNENI|nr:hypothetical protein QTO34_010618 [Eptesicus nilssonii]